MKRFVNCNRILNGRFIAIAIEDDAAGVDKNKVNMSYDLLDAGTMEMLGPFVDKDQLAAAVLHQESVHRQTVEEENARKRAAQEEEINGSGEL